MQKRANLDNSYYDGSATTNLLAILQGWEIPKVQESFIMKKDLNVDFDWYIDLITADPSFRDLFLLFVDKSVVDYNDDARMLEITYPVIDGKFDETISKIYNLTYGQVVAFMTLRMYARDLLDIKHRVSMYKDLLLISNPITLQRPPQIGALREEGQLKILVDVILSVEDADLQPGDKVLVVGSSCDRGDAVEKSYEIVAHMVPGTEWHLYDPQETEGTKIVDGPYPTRFYHVKNAYQLQSSDVERYALYLDDAYVPPHVQPQQRFWDVMNLYKEFKNYSVKWFPYYSSHIGNKYHQMFFTHSQEFRAVTRSLHTFQGKWDYRFGVCAACMEMKMKLRGTYPDSFYKFFMNYHRRNCVTGVMSRAKKKRDHVVPFYTWYPVNLSGVQVTRRFPSIKKVLLGEGINDSVNQSYLVRDGSVTYVNFFDSTLPTYEKSHVPVGLYYMNWQEVTLITGFYCLITDPIVGYPIVQYDRRMKAAYRIIVSTFENLPRDILIYGYVVLLVNEKMYANSDIIPGCIYGKTRREGIVEQVNISMQK